MSLLNVDNMIKVTSLTDPTTTLQCQSIDVFSGAIDFHRFISTSTTPLKIITIPDESGNLVLDTGNQTISNKLLHNQNGSNLLPSYTFQSDTDTGIYRETNNTLGFSCGTTKSLIINDTTLTPNIPIEAPIGAFNRPSYAFQGGTGFNNCGFYMGASNTLLCTINSQNFWRAGALNGFQVFNTFGTRTIDGNATLCGFNFNSESGSGMYRAGIGDVGISASGVRGLGIEQQGIKLYGSTAGNNANYVPSKLSYYQETTTAIGTFVFGSQTQTSNYRLSRIGNQCMMIVENNMAFGAPGSASVFIDFTTQILAQFRPTSPVIIGNVLVFDNATASLQYWYVSIATTGPFSIARTLGTTTSGCTLYGFSVSWVI